MTGLLPEEIEQRRKQYEYYREKLLTFDDNMVSQPASQPLITSRFFELLAEVEEILGISADSKVEWVTLGEIGEFTNGSGMPKSMFDDNGEVGAIHYGHIYTRYGNFVTEPFVRISEENAIKLKKVKYGDLVIARTSENIEDIMKTVAYLGNDEVVAGGHSAIFTHNENPKYLTYVFNSYSELIKQKNRFTRGTKVMELSIKDMAKIKIPLPSLEEQNRIVKILDKFDTLTNDITQGLPKEIELRTKQYEYFRKKLLSFD